MAKATGEFICITDIPRHSVANALQMQARTDYGDAINAVREAFKNAMAKVCAASVPSRLEELKDAVASARLEVNAACDQWNEASAAAHRLYEAGVEVQSDEEPPKEEIPQNV